MNLRSGQSFWLLKNGLLAVYPPLPGDATCEVAIVGGGITGALLADRLAAEGVDVLLLEKRDIGTGSTAASTALLQYAVDVHLTELIEQIGEERAVRSYRLGVEAVEKIGALCGELHDGDFESKPTLYFASQPKHVEALKLEFECRRRHGFDVSYLAEGEVAERYSIGAPAAILSRGDGQCDPYRLTHKLLARAIERGARVYDRTTVTELETTADGVGLLTDRGRVAARKVIVATGFESDQFLKRKPAKLLSTFAIVGEPLQAFSGWPDRCLMWETARPYFYLRTTVDGRAMMGGEDHPVAAAHKFDGLLERKAALLAERFQRLFPEIPLEVAYAWSGVFSTTQDGLAYIGETPEAPNAYFALGYGANGITGSVAAADIISDLFHGRPNADAAIYRLDR